MAPLSIARRITTLRTAAPVLRFFADSPQIRHEHDPGMANFLFGNPHELALPGFVEALRTWSVPRDKDWYAYKNSDPHAQAVVAEALRARHGLPFEPEDVTLTNGAFGALAIAMNAVVDPGDEVVFISPPWFFYEALIVGCGGVPVRIRINLTSFDLDVGAIEQALSSHTRAVIINSPHNPTGKIYPPETLQRLAAVLTAAAERNGRPIYLLSDEAYSRILYDGHAYHTPSRFYPHTMLIYTYGKTLLAPGQRLGYIALAPEMPERTEVRDAVALAQLATGYTVANALLQHGLADIERLSIDLAHLQRKRDRMVTALRAIGYDVHAPEGTFYLIPRSPWADDQAFADLLLRHDVLVLPGIWVELPGRFRISLTANDDMIEHALPGFAAAWQEAATHEPAPVDASS